MSVRGLQLRAELEEAEVLRYMGYPPGRSPRGRLAARWAELLAEARRQIAAKGCFRLVEGEALEPAGMPAPSQRVAVALVTIGADLEHEVSAYTAAGDRVAAMVLDACGSAAVEDAAEALYRDIRRACAGDGLCAQRRISPGYGRWNIRGQGELLRLLPAVELGVELTAGMMMVPRKSVSFATRLSPLGDSEVSSAGSCESCDLAHCPYSRRHSQPKR